MGTVAAGVAKAGADHVVIAGHEGGTGSSPLSARSSRPGCPGSWGWPRRSRRWSATTCGRASPSQVDGQMKTGRDVVVAGLLGAEEMGFSTAPLIATGCIMMRVCHLNTCPVGIATQDPELRRRFEGTPEHVVNYFFLVAEEAREIMARLGIRTLRRPHRPGRPPRVRHRHQPLEGGRGRPVGRPGAGVDRPGRTSGARWRTRRPSSTTPSTTRSSPPPGRRSSAASPSGSSFGVRNRNRTVGGLLSSAIATAYGEDGPARRHDHRHASTGPAGRASGPGWPRASTSPSSATPTTTPARASPAACWRCDRRSGRRSWPRRTSSSATPCSTAPRRGGPSSGAWPASGSPCATPAPRAVVEGVGDHGCEYMTGGRVVVLGETGPQLRRRHERRHRLRPRRGRRVRRPVQHRPRGPRGRRRRRPRLRAGAGGRARPPDRVRPWPHGCWSGWDEQPPAFVKVMPRDYKKALARLAEAERRTGSSDARPPGLPADRARRSGRPAPRPGRAGQRLPRGLHPAARPARCSSRRSAAWPAAFPSATTAARSGTSSRSGTTSSTRAAGGRPTNASTTPTTFPSSPATPARRRASRPACSRSTTTR